MKPGYFQTIFKNDEERRVAAILLKIIIALFAAYLAVVVSGLYWGDWTLIFITLAGGIMMIVPLALLIRGHLRASALVVVLVVLVTVTIIAMNGQGIHDLAVMAYPVIIVISSLLFQRREFLLSSFLALCALGWLVFGEAGGFFVSQKYLTPSAPDFVIAAIILMVAIMAVDLLAENLRENMRQAQREIANRKTIETQLRHQSIHDTLTGIYNRAFFEEELARLENASEFPVSIIVADVDGLKIVNDTRGHAVGDELLRQAAASLHAVFRASDILARIGGDEFAVLLPCTDSAKVGQILLRIHKSLADHNAAFPDLPVMVSLGAATSEDGNLAEIFIIADQHMYADKLNRKTNAGQVQVFN